MATITPTVTVIGLTTAAGSLAKIVDGDEGAGWNPGATRLSSLTDTFTDITGAPNVGKAFACLQFDYGVAVRAPLFLVQVQSSFSLGDCMLIGSDNPATVPTDIVQSGDILLGLYPRHQVVAGAILTTAMKTTDVSKRYLRLVFHATGALMTPEGTPTIEGGSSANSRWFDGTSGSFEVPDVGGGSPYILTAEGWGAGASGGESGNASDGGDSSISYDFTVVIAEGGFKSALTTVETGGSPALGGTASGANVANISGGVGGMPSPSSGGFAGYSGKGGDSPNGGTGGAEVYSGHPFRAARAGNAGNGPGGGGSGRILFGTGMSGMFEKSPGGGAGAYFKHQLVVSDSGDVTVGGLIGFVAGAGGVSSQPNGNGAPGRIKFSW
jgi:hypothetical protein